MITGLLTIIFILCSFGFYCACRCEKRFEDTLPLWLGGIIVFLFFMGIIKQLYMGVILLCSVTLGLYTVPLLLDKDDRTESLKRGMKFFFTPGLFLFVLFAVVITYATFGTYTWEGDEFSHWADIVKVMFLYDDFGTNPAAHSQYASYTPGISLLQYFIIKLYSMCFGITKFSDWMLFPVFQLFMLSFFFPFLPHVTFDRNIRKGFWGQILLCIIGGCVFLAPTVFFPYAYGNILVDIQIGIVSGALAATVVTRKNKDWLYYGEIFVGLAVLVLLKDAGLMFSAIAAILFVIRELLEYKADDTYDIKAFWLYKIFPVPIAVLLPNFLWKMNIKSSGIVEAFPNKVDINELVAAVSGKADNYRSEAFRIFINELFRGTKEFGPLKIKIPYALLTVILALIVFLIFLYYNKQYKKTGEGKIKYIVALFAAILLVHQHIIFTCGLEIAYLFKFREIEAMLLASFDRYTSIAYTSMGVYIVLSLFDISDDLYNSPDNKTPKDYIKALVLPITLAAVIVLTAGLGETLNVIKGDLRDFAVEEMAIYTDVTDKIPNNKDTKVFIVSQEIPNTNHGINNYDFYKLRYILRPCNTNDYPMFSFTDEQTYNLEQETKTNRILTNSIVKSPEDWMEELINDNYDYVIVFRTNDFFNTEYAPLFENPADIADKSVFAVDRENKVLIKVP